MSHYRTKVDSYPKWQAWMRWSRALGEPAILSAFTAATSAVTLVSLSLAALRGSTSLADFIARDCSSASPDEWPCFQGLA